MEEGSAKGPIIRMSDEQIEAQFAELQSLQTQTARVVGLLTDAVARQAEFSVRLEENVGRLSTTVEQAERAAAVDRERLDRLSLTVSELTDKLNGVIGFLDSRQ